MPAGVPQADARTVFTSVPDVTILAADRRRELLDEAAAFRLGREARLARQARRRSRRDRSATAPAAEHRVPRSA
jgi:hypothetical protein